ncbi:putative DNA repair glycosylase MJ1434 [Gammaproteobacteria bacterium]
MDPATELHWIYNMLLSAYGPQHWWPGDTSFEVMVGAILTQNTTWRNVERAIQALVAADHLNPTALASANPETLGAWLRPVGYFNVKTKRLQNFCRWYLAQGQEEGLAKIPTMELRRELLAVNGIGPETADDILLYACNRSVFVIDAYTRRLLARFMLARGNESYEMLRAFFEAALASDAAIYNEYHALIVRHAKEVCYKRQPACESCALEAHCLKFIM